MCVVICPINIVVSLKNTEHHYLSEAVTIPFSARLQHCLWCKIVVLDGASSLSHKARTFLTSSWPLSIDKLFRWFTVSLVLTETTTTLVDILPITGLHHLIGGMLCTVKSTTIHQIGHSLLLQISAVIYSKIIYPGKL